MPIFKLFLRDTVIINTIDYRKQIGIREWDEIGIGRLLIIGQIYSYCYKKCAFMDEF